VYICFQIYRLVYSDYMESMILKACYMVRKKAALILIRPQTSDSYGLCAADRSVTCINGKRESTGQFFLSWKASCKPDVIEGPLEPILANCLVALSKSISISCRGI
jgi:hypothetical protein